MWAMTERARNARLAGFLYLLLAIAGPVRLMYIPSVLFVRGDAAATAANIAARSALFRLGIVTDLLSAILALFVTLALYRLLSDVNKPLAILMVILGGLMVTPIGFVNVLNDGAALIVAKGADFLTPFSQPQRDALLRLFLRMQHQGVVANQTFWGLWLVPFGLLVFKSGFLPRVLGVWLIVNGVGYVAASVTGLTMPKYEDAVGSVLFPALFGEPAIILYLLIRGARTT